MGRKVSVHAGACSLACLLSAAQVVLAALCSHRRVASELPRFLLLPTTDTAGMPAVAGILGRF